MDASDREPLSPATVESVARLARLRLSAEDLDRVRTELTAILDHFAVLDTLDLDSVEPMAHPLGLINQLRPDEPAPPLPRRVALDAAPAEEEGFFSVPRVIDGKDAP